MTPPDAGLARKYGATLPQRRTGWDTAARVAVAAWFIASGFAAFCALFAAAPPNSPGLLMFGAAFSALGSLLSGFVASSKVTE